ncbi:hypothetical protein PR048_016431 [Dryococelus australis]|uniref:Uncharacterized protein n=1 Tax=Dryococelus australis TaxID=614101 RepID=A0ABQ9HK48_9NEOP|nr:hypothetical protein PR048_016431 [Dryococelus australis]
MHMTAASWTSIPQSVIANCFRKAGFTHASVSSITTVRNPPRQAQILIYLMSVFLWMMKHCLEIQELKNCVNRQNRQDNKVEMMTDTEVKVAHSQAYENSVAFQSNVPEHVMHSIFHFDHFLLMQGNATKRQTTIKDFFRG